MLKRRILFTLAILPAILSCNQRDPEIPDLGSSKQEILLHSGKPQLDANAESSKTKTFLMNGNILWSSGDRISVFAEREGKWKFASGGLRDSTLAEFIISPTELSSDSEEASYAVPSSLVSEDGGEWVFHGVYPSNCLIDKQMSDKDGFRFRLGYRQIASKRDNQDNFDSSCDIMVGSTEKIYRPEKGKSYPIEWKRLVSHLSLNLSAIPYLASDEKVTSISLNASNGAALVGDFKYELSSGKCSAISASSIVNIVSDGNTLQMTEGAIRGICLCLIPHDIKGLKVEIRTDRAVYFKEFADLSIVLNTNKRTELSLDMGGATVEQSSTIEGDPNNTLMVSKAFDISIPEHVIAQIKKTGMGIFELYTPEVNATAAVDLHLEVFPMYVFGNERESGDYYCVEGYLLSHNNLIFAERSNQGVKLCGWYPSQYCLDFELLTPDGKVLVANDADFFVEPEPSTTISSWTYTKGTTFTLEPKLTFGSVRKDGLSGVLSWMNTLMGSISFGYRHDSSATQTLPDQTVLQSTELNTAKVHYELTSHNDTGGYSTKDIPAVLTKDQRFDFSWVWHLKSGKYCAKDYDFGNMKMKATIKPIYKSAYKGTIRNNQGRAVFEGWAFYDHKDLSLNFDMPAMNRIPVGDIELKVATGKNIYLTGMQVYRSGEYKIAKQPYFSERKGYGPNKTVNMQLRAGTYDLIFNLQNGSSGAIISRMIIPNVEVKAGAKVELSTYDGDELED